MIQTWKRKRGDLRQVIEFLNNLQMSHPQFFTAPPMMMMPMYVHPPPPPPPQQFRTSKVNPIKKTMSIQQKFGIERREPVVQEPKRRKLVRGSRNPKPDYEENEVFEEEEKPKSLTILQKYNTQAPAKKKKKVNLSDDEEEDEPDELDSGEDDDEDYNNQQPVNYAAVYEFNNRVLQFLNSASVRDIVDIGGCTLAIAEKLVQTRPYHLIAQLEADDMGEEKSKRSGRGMARKPHGLKIVDRTAVTLRGYDAVDSLVHKCQEFGNIISGEMHKWGINVIGEKGELEATEVLHNNGTYFTNTPKYFSSDFELKLYQQVGINWLNLLYQNNLSCILADEMGLGKTCQVISFFAHLKEIGVDEGPHLVVVPASTLENWLREFKKFCPVLKVAPYYGSQQERAELRYDLESTDFDILVTTYNLCTGQKEDMKFLRAQGFNVVVYDEGHMLKNSSSERYNKLMRLKGNFRLLLTGTPLQNNLKELISLLAFILPDLFKEKKDDLQILFNQKVKTKGEEEDFNPLLSVRAISRAKTMMTPFILRRKKAQVLTNLPAKTSHIEYCENTPMQEELYQRHIKEGKELQEKGEKQTNVIMKLRKTAIHPLLYRTHFTDEVLLNMAKDIMREPQYVNNNVQFIFEDMQVMSDFELIHLCNNFPNSIGKYKPDLSKEIFNSGKFLKLQKILPTYLDNNGRVLIFSLFTQVLDILEVLLSELNVKFVRLDGQTSVELRQDIIDKFYNDESIKVFILSTKAGGFGINLACANTVIIFDQSFNPHDDRQAEDRAHRVGQKREVKVIRLITKNTIEENIYAMAQSKLALDQQVSESTDTALTSLFGELFEDKAKGDKKSS